MMMENKPYLVALNYLWDVGPRTVMKLLKKWPRLQDMFSLSNSQLVAAGLPERLATAIAQFDIAQLEVDWRWQSEARHHILTWVDPEYPPLLKEIYDPPPVLYACGDLACLQSTCVAMVGTRKPSIVGKETARQFAAQLAQHNITIVSGLALGIDAQAHRGCMDVLGKTVAVMGTGLKQIYPRQHSELAQQIAQDGLLLSEFTLHSTAKAGHFPRRNRIISGLSLCTVIVEAAIKSGSLITARFALEQNRDVMALPGSIHNPQARGCNQLLQQGAKLVTSAEDVLEELGILSRKEMTSRKQEGLASDNENLVKWIEFDCTTIEQIIVRSGLKIETVMCQLAELELQGMVRAVPGGYARCQL